MRLRDQGFKGSRFRAGIGVRCQEKELMKPGCADVAQSVKPQTLNTDT